MKPQVISKQGAGALGVIWDKFRAFSVDPDLASGGKCVCIVGMKTQLVKQIMARLTVKALADLSGVSVRTLHYYDEIGLLHPADVGENGYRYYDRPEILRLQQILLYREVGVSLSKIGEILDAPDFDVLDALRAHRHQFAQELERRGKLLQTIDQTILEIEGKAKMVKESSNPFEGFAPEKQAHYEQELIDEHGEFARARIIESRAKVDKMSTHQMQEIKGEGHQINLDLVEMIKAGYSSDDAKVQAVVARHHAWVSHFWTPNAQAYEGLGQSYLAHPDFRAFYDKYDARLADFLAEAMTHYATQQLD